VVSEDVVDLFLRTIVAAIVRDLVVEDFSPELEESKPIPVTKIIFKEMLCAIVSV